VDSHHRFFVFLFLRCNIRGESNNSQYLLPRQQHSVPQDRYDSLTSTTHCNTLQHAGTPCNTLQHTATHCNTLQHPATPCNTLQHPATHCNALQHTAPPCTTLQHTATHISQGYCVVCLLFVKANIPTTGKAFTVIYLYT